jgi:mannan endo-1,4-beta-mannosidase
MKQYLTGSDAASQTGGRRLRPIVGKPGPGFRLPRHLGGRAHAVLLLGAIALAGPIAAQPATAQPAPQAAPVTPDASPEARALLQLLYDISGKYTLTGQHNNPNTKSRNSDFATRYLGKTPIIFGSDWGHAKAGDSDSYLARPDIVQEAVRQNARGEIVALCWHAVPPTTDEPGTFRPLPNADPKHLASVQGKLLDEQFRDILTPGTALYEHWCAQVDAIAGFLKQLEAAHVAVLWRPYHEMNGDWFWWGGRTGEYSTAALYRQIFDRLVNHHHLTNLVWVWSMDRPSQPGREFAKYFPGIQYVDVLGLDVYGSDFNQSYYDGLAALSQGKPLALAEVGTPPAPEVLERQPRWAYYMTWSGMVHLTTRKQYDALFADPRILWLEGAAYGAASEPYRRACGMQPLRFEPKPADFTGTWVFDEDRSSLGRMGGMGAPAAMEVVQAGADLSIKTTRIVEFADDQVTEQKLTLDGAEHTSTFMNSPQVTRALVSPAGDELHLDSSFSFGGGPKMTISDVWRLTDAGRHLAVHRHVVSQRGVQDSDLVFDRR